ncbi:MAG: AbrB-like transcriptional regulator [Synechococcaceae cyanobacterium ELA445]
MLTGADLLAKIEELGDVSKFDLVRAAGYVSTKLDGTERLNFTDFYQAVLEAQNEFEDLGSREEGGGMARNFDDRKLSYVATVQGNGNLCIGRAYTALLELDPGDEFEIKPVLKQINLIHLDSDEELIKLIPLSAAEEG